MTASPVRIVVADDHPLVRDGLRALLGSVPGYELVAEAGDGQEAVEAVEAHRPDVVIMDLHMPGVDGVEATRRIAAGHPGVAVLVVTMIEDDASLFAALRAGARGYLLKGAEQEQILRAIDAVAAGEAIFGQSVAQRLLEQVASPPPTAPPPPFPELTAREREILDRVAAGDSNGTIARRFGLSTKTVANHVSNILTKLQVLDRSHAIVLARDAGLGGGDGGRAP